ncbi:MAG: hypothetical protein IJG59_03865 [Erysipelotrichaceae bacterium]|nr:hypothetical protein [Erysipelotrichaceae bacterium]
MAEIYLTNQVFYKSLIAEDLHAYMAMLLRKAISCGELLKSEIIID